MNGPVVLSLIGGAIVVAALVLTWAIVRPDRYRVDTVGGFGGGSADFPAMLRVQGRLTMLAASGAAVQSVALLWEANR